MNAKVDIVINEYNENEHFVVVKRGNENLYMAMGLCQFIDEMGYWGMPAKGVTFNGEAGYVFSKESDIEDITMEIERFIIHNDI